MMNIIISDTNIRQDVEGRYCLNDLHRASGSEKRHQPSDWLRQQQTQDLIAEVNKSKPGIPGIESKQGLGTFVCRELVYAYAMWISPAFHLKVIRVFDNIATQPRLPAAINNGLPEFRRARAIDMTTKSAERIFANLPGLSSESKQVIYANLLNPIAGTEVIALPGLAERTYSATEVGERLGVSRNRIGIIANRHNLKTDEYGMFVLDKAAHSDKQIPVFRYNEAGITKIEQLLQQEPAPLAAVEPISKNIARH